MKFKTQFDPHERVFSECGSRFVPIYHTVIDKDTGHIELVKDDLQKKDLYAEIQSYRDACDVHKIIERYQAGDVDVLQRVQGIYGDISTMPKNIHEFFELEERISEHFDQLPADIKNRFDNSFIQYAMLANTDPEEWHRRQDVQFSKEEASEKGDGE